MDKRHSNERKKFRPKLAAAQLAGLLLFAGVLDEQMTDGAVRTKAAEIIGGLLNDKSSAEEAIPVSPSSVNPNSLQSNEISNQMLNDLTPYQPVDAKFVYEEMSKSNEVSRYFGEQISTEDSMRYFYIAGFRGEELQIITAISKRESRGFPGAVGDWNYKDSGSISVGLTQIRCITEGNELPCEGPREWWVNLDPLTAAVNTRKLYEQSIDHYGYGEGKMRYDGAFHPWKWYEEHVDRYGPDPAENRYLPEVQEIYAVLSAQYGDMSV